MAMNLEAVLRIAAQVTGLENITRLERGLQAAETAAVAAQGGFRAVVNSSAWQAAAAAAAGFGVAIGVSARAAMDFESSMADVRKVVDGLESPRAFAEMKGEILDLSRQMPITAQGFAEIYAAAGQSGIAKDELRGFATMVAQVAVAFDMTAEDAGRSLAQLKVSLGLTTEEVGSLADAMNHVSNNTGATASNLVEFMTRSGAVGRIAGLSGEETMAFGAAMIQTGIQTEVAATSFNNMIKALSKGSSMTEKQTSVLRRLGYSIVNAAEKEEELTRAAEEQSRRRLAIAKGETDQLSREINRRYRDQMQALEDSWSDEASAQERALEGRADMQINALEAQRDLEISAAQQRADASGASADMEVNRIRASYDQRIEAIRDAMRRDVELNRRAARDRQQQIRDQLEDQEAAELQAVQDRYDAVQEAEKVAVEEAKASAKEQGQALATASMQGFSERMQTDAIGTITEVLGRINALPESQQISALSDLFGDEARGLAPLLSNLGELERILGLAGDKTAYTGSVLREFQVRSETAANKLQLFRNNMQALSIVVGETVLPALVRLAEVFGPIIKGLADFAAQNPVITTALVAIGGLLSGIVLAAPFLVSLITLLGQIGPLLAGIGGTIAGYSAILLPVQAAFSGFLTWITASLVPGITAALSGVLAWIGSTLIPGLLAFFSGPVGWTVLAIAAVAAMAIAFREPLMEFVDWLWEWGEPIREFWAGLWDGLVEIVGSSINTFKEVLGTYFGWVRETVSWFAQAAWAIWWQIFVQPFINVWDAIKEPVTQFFNWASGVFRSAFDGLLNIAYTIWVSPWVELWNNVLRQPVINAWTWLQGVWGQLGSWFSQYVAQPIANAWEAVVTFLPNAMQNVVNTVRGIWTGMIDGIKNGIRGMLQYMAGLINNLTRIVNRLISGFNALPGPDIPLIPQIVVPAFARGGVVDRATLALVGEAGQEYIIPASQMADAARNFLAGARGASVLASNAAGGGSGAISGGDSRTTAVANLLNELSGFVQMLGDAKEAAEQSANANEQHGNETTRLEHRSARLRVRMDEWVTALNRATHAVRRFSQALNRAPSYESSGGSRSSSGSSSNSSSGSSSSAPSAETRAAVSAALTDLGETPLARTIGDAVRDSAVRGVLREIGESPLARGIADARQAQFDAVFKGIIKSPLVKSIRRARRDSINALFATLSDALEPIQFATGGVVDRPTLAMIGEGGEREYVIPESKMAAASARYLRAYGGGDVMPGQGGVSIGSPQINVTTGPVLQHDGQQYVTMQDLERAMRMTAEGVIGQLRTPAARTVLGLS